MKSFLILIILFSFQVSFSQNVENRISHIGVSANYENADFITLVNYSLQNKKLIFRAGFGVGLRRTVFQGAFFPNIHLSGSYILVQKKSSIIYSGLKAKISQLKFINSLERNFGLLPIVGYSVGRKLKIGVEAGIGLGCGTIQSIQKYRFNYLAFEGNLCLNYAL
ncbi:MAG: hypothetical protein ACI9XP_000755 [Lentimonas sp.]|jgi:hypothetical protein